MNWKTLEEILAEWPPAATRYGTLRIAGEDGDVGIMGEGLEGILEIAHETVEISEAAWAGATLEIEDNGKTYAIGTEGAWVEVTP